MPRVTTVYLTKVAATGQEIVRSRRNNDNSDALKTKSGLV